MEPKKDKRFFMQVHWLRVVFDEGWSKFEFDKQITVKEESTPQMSSTKKFYMMSKVHC